MVIMNLIELISALTKQDAYPHTVGNIEIRQTHISVVFLAGEFAYKIRKPLKLDFLDFSTLDRRHHDCLEEVRLNRRLAASVYLGVVPICQIGSCVQIDGQGPAIEWAVRMIRLPETASLQWQLRHGNVTEDQVRTLARRIARFHQTTESQPHISTFGRFSVVAKNARDNFREAQGQIGVTVSERVFQRFRELTESESLKMRNVIENRAERGIPKDTHGDLRLEHVYLFPERSPPDDCLIVDCIEFNERFRFADPVSDSAFLIMDLLAENRSDLAQVFQREYFSTLNDSDGEQLLPFYVAYRAAIRGKVEGVKSAESEVTPDERIRAQQAARGYWLLGLSQLEIPDRRPCLILTAGLPGTGKSTLARQLAEGDTFVVIRTDIVRKELAHDVLHQATSFGEGIYSPNWNERTYAECVRQAEQLLFNGKRVIVDATFRSETTRERFLAMARNLAIPCIVVVCVAPEHVVRARLQQRIGDASDANWEIYLRTQQEWQQPRSQGSEHIVEVDTTEPGAVEKVIQLMRALGLRS